MTVDFLHCQFDRINKLDNFRFVSYALLVAFHVQLMRGLTRIYVSVSLSFLYILGSRQLTVSGHKQKTEKSLNPQDEIC